MTKRLFDRLIITPPRPYSVNHSPRVGPYLASKQPFTLDSRVIPILDSQGERVGTARGGEESLLIGRVEGSSQAAKSAETLVRDRVLNSVFFEVSGKFAYLDKNEIIHIWAENSIEPEDVELKILNDSKVLPLANNAIITAIHLSVSLADSTRFVLIHPYLGESSTPTEVDSRAEAMHRVAMNYHTKQRIERLLKKHA